DRKVVHDATVSQDAAAPGYRFERSRETARGADGRDQVTPGQDHLLAGLDVGGRDGQLGFEFLERLRQEVSQERLQAVAFQQAALQADVDDVAQAGVTHDADDVFRRAAACVQRTDDRAHRGTGDHVRFYAA